MKKKYFAPYVLISKININPVMSAASPQTTEDPAQQGDGMDVKRKSDEYEDELLDEELIQETSGWKNGLW